MRIIARSTLINFYQMHSHGDAKSALEAWYREVRTAVWQSWKGVKQKYGNASILKNNRVVFNICGNKYRLVVKINYDAQVVYIRFIGTHRDYDKINAEEI
ncbi:MAG: type II toxin-antitoxin system HigB family toxin [Dehalococcoidales bacterium]|nr:type II toxin-antitoxin system HigB family toxin [Dehalococcoidales bacterium]